MSVPCTSYDEGCARHFPANGLLFASPNRVSRTLERWGNTRLPLPLAECSKLLIVVEDELRTTLGANFDSRECKLSPIVGLVHVMAEFVYDCFDCYTTGSVYSRSKRSV